MGMDAETNDLFRKFASGIAETVIETADDDYPVEISSGCNDRK